MQVRALFLAAILGSPMLRPDRFIGSCTSWSEFWERAKSLPSQGEKGAVFERLTQLYLQTTPEYRSELEHVWTLREVPPDVRKRLALPILDEGIDFIARTRHGVYWAIQSKFRSQHDKPLTRKELGTFTSLAFNTCSNIALAVVAHTASKPVSKRHLMRNTTEIGLDRWQSLDQEAWSLIVGTLKGKSAAPKARSPRPHQNAAVAAAKTHFIRDGAARGRLIMPCGTGKSLTAYWIAEALKAKTILVAVPSLALVRQSLTDWTREFLAHDIKPDWLCVCSDETVGNLERDEFVGEVYDLGLPTYTDTKEIAALLRARSSGPKIVFTTYQSSAKLASAARKARITFDLAILDEAHKTVGVHSKTFATLLSNKKIKVQRRVFMTATERVFRGDRSDVLSMDNEKDYGVRFFQLSFKEAIKQKIITDYKILTMAVSDSHIRELIDRNSILKLNSRDLDEAEAQSIAAGIALKRIYKRHGVKHAISFHRSIRSADRFREQQDALNRTSNLGPRATNLHISSKKTAGQRSDLLREFAFHKRALMTNARCLTEGVDVPAIDCVMFADPKQSRVDIVQAAGRALRHHQEKEYGYIVVPLVVPEKMEFEKFAKTTAFRKVAQTITALSTQDERIADEFRAIEHGHVSSGKIIEIEGDIPAGMKMKLGDFAKAISTRVWESVGRANWRRFEEARIFARGLGFKSPPEWSTYSQSGDKPTDIPSNPDKNYTGLGWAGWSDWLGTDRTARGNLRSFEEARTLARTLGLKSQSEWRVYHRSGEIPRDIPINAHQAYADVGWAGWGDWLGTGRFGPGLRQYRSFKDARAYARDLELKSGSEWFAYCKSGKKPPDIPTSASRVYADKGWAGFRDWLGIEYRRTGRTAPGRFRPFEQARAFVRRLGLKSQPEWSAYCNSGQKPADIPNTPHKVYADDGWAGIGDWLGTGRIAPGQFRPFKDARAYVRGLGLKSWVEWDVYCKSGRKPPDIPIHPHAAYAHVGWAGRRDWITDNPQYLSFKKARSIVHSLALKSAQEWNAFCTSGKKPADIPSTPYKIYAEDGWAGWSDWLGTPSRKFQTFEEARSYVRDLGLKSETEWFAYCKSGKRPDDIPTSPRRVYVDNGWIGMADWLGAGRSYQYRTFNEARAFVQALGLKSSAEWSAYCRSGRKPADIPAAPSSVYADKGWIGFGDWLGTSTVAPQLRQYRSFEDARGFARALGLKLGVEWKAYCKSGRKPNDIPANPQQTYANDGWSGFGDWLGYVSYSEGRS
jgi:superfamily II DNA or RNA helicase